MKKKRILYCMQVSWYWIKQRPHFIAEGLAGDYEITVVDRQEYKKDVINKTGLRVYHRFRLPFERSCLIEKINNLLYRLQYHQLSKSNDVIWITSPIQYKFLGSCSGKKIVYDCMDDMPALAKKKRRRKDAEKYEKKLIKRADVVFASSSYLRNHLIEKYSINREISVVNNAIKDNFADYSQYSIEDSGIILPLEKINMTYIGTISSWFDFDLVIRTLNNNPNLMLNLFGPNECKIPQHPQIKHYGSIEHKYILCLMEKSDVLVMPFVVNELIRSVNPVKLYEYVYSGRPCVAPRYGETEQFSEYVRLYDNQETFEKIISDIISGKVQQKPKTECEFYAMQNTWAERVKLIKQKLNSL